MIFELFQKRKTPALDTIGYKVDLLIHPEVPESISWPLLEVEIRKDKRGYRMCFDNGKRVKCPPAEKVAKDKKPALKSNRDSETAALRKKAAAAGFKPADAPAAKPAMKDSKWAQWGDRAGLLGKLSGDGPKLMATKAPGKAPAKRLSKADREKLGKEKAAAIDNIVTGIGQIQHDGGSTERMVHLRDQLDSMDRPQLAGVLKGLGWSDSALAGLKGKRTTAIKGFIAHHMVGQHQKSLAGMERPEDHGKRVAAALKAAGPGATSAKMGDIPVSAGAKAAIAKMGAAAPASEKPAAPAAKMPKPEDMSRADILKLIQSDASISPAEKKELATDDTDSLRNFIGQKMKAMQKDAGKKPEAGSVKSPEEGHSSIQKLIGDATKSGAKFDATMDATDKALKTMSDSVRLALGSRYAGEKLDDADDADAAIRAHVASQAKKGKASAPTAKPAPARKDAFSGGDWAPIKPLKKK